EAAKNTDPAAEFFRQHLRGGQVIWDVTKPNKKGAARQDPSEFVFNGPIACEPCGPAAYGECTDDLPAQVLHNGTNDSLPNGTPCGPTPDQWDVLSGGTAWHCISHDI